MLRLGLIFKPLSVRISIADAPKELGNLFAFEPFSSLLSLEPAIREGGQKDPFRRTLLFSRSSNRPASARISGVLLRTGEDKEDRREKEDVA